MCYLIAIKFGESGSIALKAKRSPEFANFVDEYQEEIGYNIQLVTITRPSAYSEYEPYQFVETYDEFQEKVNLLLEL